ncbi:MAG: hypothetical protein LBV43_13260 [Prevotella sp.]|jgi:hypothetical protein|nr:hypothetical protein [Prevotella sp.]
MKKVLFSLLAVAIIMVSCGGADPVKFNDALVKANTVISEVSSNYDSELSDAINSEAFDKISTLTDSALVKIKAEIETVKNLDAPKGGEKFKETAIKTYESLSTLVETGKKFSTLTAESSEEQFDGINKEYTAKMEEYSKVFQELVDVQMEYAKEAGYKVNN